MRKATPSAGCKEPEPRDPDLAAGLDLYYQAKWADAGARLDSWSRKPEARADPAAARGFYAMAYALRSAGRPQEAAPAMEAAKGLLEARIAQEPTLEAYYSLAALNEMRGDTPGSLQVVATALAALEGTPGDPGVAGKARRRPRESLCANPDADDLFRKSRLLGMAGRRDEEMAVLHEAARAQAAGSGRVPTYRAFTEKLLAEEARGQGRLADAEAHLLAAAAIDPTLPNVHRTVGLLRLKEGDAQGAADYWRENWRRERNNGNALVYAIPVLDKLVRGRARFGESERVPNLAEYTVPALEQNAILEGRRLMEMRTAEALARQEGRAFPPEEAAALAIAEYRMVQFLTEYVLRDGDLPEFALRNGLLAAIHDRTLPSQQ